RRRAPSRHVRGPWRPRCRRARAARPRSSGRPRGAPSGRGRLPSYERRRAAAGRSDSCVLSAGQASRIPRSSDTARRDLLPAYSAAVPPAPDDRPRRPTHDAPGTRAARGDHYFTAEPATPQQRRDLTVVLAGREVTVEVAAGVFSPGRVDPGTRVLLDAVPPPPAEGDLVDLGCGWGPVALTMALRAPGARVWAVDV